MLVFNVVGASEHS